MYLCVCVCACICKYTICRFSHTYIHTYFVLNVCKLLRIHECFVVQLGLVSSIPETATNKIEGMKAKLSELWASLQDNKEELADKERQLKALLQPYVRQHCAQQY
jgi:hypothetical protein